ncbi:MAG: phosphatase [Cyanobacteria bacterium QH_9_48_43]|jgi:secreted PhoX family phosphatase|nr:MAG: phosphatase [Cyanobacteria bacterium QH_9_48_43]PSO97381.1 MAG: phosphatase [Cyanobacteria bacterium SW_12_48_29]PSP13351.1 MAG: phosphatase [Cyanobacteria bacterium SW_11_48_12]PSP23764.1 MAG: phosphatase [Cyanobacteria bacterium SW_5_48_44]
MRLSRRKFFALTGASAAGSLLVGSPLKALYARKALGQSVRAEGFGPLIRDPEGLLDLPKGFQYRVFSRTGDRMSDGNPVPADHDGMAAFPGPDNTTILVRNHELGPDETPAVAPNEEGRKYDPTNAGGTTNLVVGPDRRLIRDYASLTGTYRNCSGGPTPWGSWISCEENYASPDVDQSVTKPHGYNFEVPKNAEGLVNPEPIKEMGRFVHEAICVDPKTGIVYETEDNGEGLFYRFVPNRKPQQPGDLKANGGVLEALRIKGMPQAITKTDFPVGEPMPVEWVRIDNPSPEVADATTVPTQGFAKGAAQFTRGEGAGFGNGEVYFNSTDGGEQELGQVWRYVPGSTPEEGGTIELLAEPNNQSVLQNPDNLVVSPFEDLFLCEDGGGTDYVRGVTPEGQLYDFARNALNDREFAGSTFSADGQTFFVNIQDPGLTFAIWGPWGRKARA